MSNVMGAPPAAPAPAPAPSGQNLSLLPQVGQPGAWKAWVTKPENRAMLVQAGIALLQPTGVGQTIAGQVGTAIGSGMEARDRVLAGEMEQDQQAIQNQINQQEADARTVAAEAAATNAAAGTAPGGLTTNQVLLNDNRTRNAWMKFLKDRTTDPYTGRPTMDTSDPTVLDSLAQEFQQLYGNAPGTSGIVPGAGTPSLAEAIPGAPPGGAQAPVPPQSHIDYLRQNPSAAADFDAKYGAGASQKYLGT